MAHQVMTDAGFAPDIPPAVSTEVQALDESLPEHAADSAIRDLRSLIRSSIDNKESRDLDQVEYAQREPNGDIRVMVGIADVDAYVYEKITRI